MTKTDLVFNKIRDNIISQYWKEGTKIVSERKLSESLHVSRVTVKAAIQKLIDEGFLEYKEGKKGTFVKYDCYYMQKSKTICVAIDNDTPLFFSTLLSGIHDSLLSQDFHTLYFDTMFNKRNVLETIVPIINSNIAGVIFAPIPGDEHLEQNKAIIKLIKATKIPLVQIDRYIDINYGSYVGMNNIKAGYNLTKEIILHGYKKILVINGDNTTSFDERIIGIKKALRESDLPYSQIAFHDLQYINHKTVKLRAVDKELIDNCEAIIGLNQVLCEMVKEHTSGKFTASIAANVSESFNNLAIIQPLKEIGKESGRLIIEKIINNNMENKHILIEGSIHRKNNND